MKKSIPETDRNARQQNETTMASANAIKSKRSIELTSGEAGIMNHKDKVYLLDWMQLYKEEQKKMCIRDRPCPSLISLLIV